MAGATRIFAGAAHTTLPTGRTARGGLFRFRAGNSQWESLTAGLPENAEVRYLLVHPTQPDVIYAGTQDGPYRSSDGGDHWEALGFPERNVVIWSMAIDPARPNVIYAGSAPVALYRSGDGGDNWKKMPQVKSPEHCGANFLSRLIRIGLEAGRPDEIYLGLKVSGVLHSADRGETWTDLSAPLLKLSEQPHLKINLAGRGDFEGMLDSQPSPCLLRHRRQPSWRCAPASSAPTTPAPPGKTWVSGVSRRWPTAATCASRRMIPR